ncbi:SbcC/MukB-like Walker B domain-containing protein [Salinibacterium amurskyense]|uniref:ATP-binding protein n=1 Tax=Salinibacterium amurskyense TaxID=205941 RepID=UPI00311D626E
MTMLDTLFGLIPSGSRGQQWVAEELQLVNWGGYDGGPHRVRFSPGATLFCGGSGSGKSTLMDAYIALMMPHTTPFNGASNGAVIGRARGIDQRNILSYGRGKTDESRTENGTKLEVLRGDGVDTWSAVSMTWVDHDGARFTAVRAWYIPSSARVLEDTVRVRASTTDAFDLKSLETAAASRLSDASIKAAGLDTLPTDREFSARLHTVLGIGAAGAGSKAMSLLARIQAGQQITTVDDLYKKMVLEEPGTLATADAVVTHFDGLEDTRLRMLTAQQQVRALEPIRGMRTRIEEATERLRVIDEVGSFSDPGSRATLWKAGRRLELLRDTEIELQSRKQAINQIVREKQALAESADLERDGLSDVLRSAGGDRLETAQRELRSLEGRKTNVQNARLRFDESLRVLKMEVASSEAFDALIRTARTTLSSSDTKAAVRRAFTAASTARTLLRSEVSNLERERHAAENRHDNIPGTLNEVRAQLARAAGLTIDDLPFVGELVEVRTEFEVWREAFNLALGGFATTVLIDVAHLPAFRAVIESVRTSQRLRYEGVHTGLPAMRIEDNRALSARLDFKKSPFLGSLQERLDRQFGYICVSDASELSNHKKALTVTGQTSDGNRGAHGGHGRANVLGFSNQRYREALDERLAAAQAQLHDATATVNKAEVAMDELDARVLAYEKVTDLTWDQVDVESVEKEQNRWETIVESITEGNPRIAQLREQIDTARRKVTHLREEIGSAKSEQKKLADQWELTTDQVDAAVVILNTAETEDVSLAIDQEAYLDGRFMAPEITSGSAPSKELARFDTALESASKRLDEDQRTASSQLQDQRESLRRTMVLFLDRWPSPNLTANPEQSLDDFERILADLETNGLHELENDWRESLLKLSGNDLTNLDSTLGRSLREIRERIEPINLIMQDLPFYDDNHRLQITLRENQSDVRKRFRRELRDVREQIEDAVTDEQRVRVYERMTRLINKIRRSSPEFAELIDVRNHVRVSAERIHATTKQHVALFDHIGEKSGGESQELIAFIVGAALRYQLGDAGAERPRYAPVFLDEALIKADAHFTKRAIGAWRGLGFQLVIGAPNDKYSAIEPHVDVEYDILKDASGRSHARAKVGLPVSDA